MTLAGKRVLITGASRGIGAALAEEFALAGAMVALLARSEGPLVALAARLGGRSFVADLNDAGELDGLLARIEAEGGPVDVLVNNAGIDLTGAFGDVTARDLDALMRVNLVAPMELSRQAVVAMLDRGHGHIVNISSMAGIGVFPGLVAYSTSKAGLSQFTAGLRADLKGTGIATTLVELGPIPSDMLAHVSSYQPTDDAFKRFYRLRLLVDIPKEQVARDVVAAVKAGKKHVRLPHRARPLIAITEFPRRFTEVLLAGVRPRTR